MKRIKNRKLRIKIDSKIEAENMGEENIGMNTNTHHNSAPMVVRNIRIKSSKQMAGEERGMVSNRIFSSALPPLKSVPLRVASVNINSNEPIILPLKSNRSVKVKRGDTPTSFPTPKNQSGQLLDIGDGNMQGGTSPRPKSTFYHKEGSKTGIPTPIHKLNTPGISTPIHKLNTPRHRLRTPTTRTPGFRTPKDIKESAQTFSTKIGSYEGHKKTSSVIEVSSFQKQKRWPPSPLILHAPRGNESKCRVKLRVVIVPKLNCPLIPLPFQEAVKDSDLKIEYIPPTLKTLSQKRIDSIRSMKITVTAENDTPTNSLPSSPLGMSPYSGRLSPDRSSHIIHNKQPILRNLYTGNPKSEISTPPLTPRPFKSHVISQFKRTNSFQPIQPDRVNSLHNREKVESGYIKPRIEQQEIKRIERQFSNKSDVKYSSETKYSSLSGIMLKRHSRTTRNLLTPRNNNRSKFGPPKSARGDSRVKYQFTTLSGQSSNTPLDTYREIIANKPDNSLITDDDNSEIDLTELKHHMLVYS